MNRYPDPDATLLRRRIAERYETEPGRVAVGNGSCEILLAAAEALCEPGAEIVYAWPSFSMYPYLAALTGAREIRVPLAEGDVHDLDAMAAEVTAATQLLIVCNPNNPTATHLPAAEIAAFCERIPRARHGRSSTRPTSSSRPTTTPTRRSTCSPTSPTWSSCAPSARCYGLAGLRVGYALGSAKFRAAIDAVRQPFSVNALAQAAGAEAILHADDVAAPGRVARSSSGSASRRACDELGLRTAETQANFSWIDLGDADEAEVVAGLAERSIAVRPGTPLGGPGHIRVSYGTRAENDRFLAALGETARLTAPHLLQSQGVTGAASTPRANPAPHAPRSPLPPSPISGDLARRPASRLVPHQCGLGAGPLFARPPARSSGGAHRK